MKPLHKLKVLIIDSNEEAARETSDLLKSVEINTITSTSPESALKALRENDDIDLVITELEIGSEIEGPDLARIILTKRDLPILFYSNFRDHNSLKKTETILSYGYIVKGTNTPVFIASLKMALKLHSTYKLQRESESIYKGFFVFYPRPLWIYNKKTLNFLNVNKAAIDKYGYSKEDFLNMKISDIRPKEDVPKLIECVNTHQAGLKKSGIWRHTSKSGKTFEVQILSHPIIWAGQEARLVIVLDAYDQIPMEIT